MMMLKKLLRSISDSSFFLSVRRSFSELSFFYRAIVFLLNSVFEVACLAA